jgi:serine/threonine protein kinase/Tfp pilus assembly protein PilF
MGLSIDTDSLCAIDTRFRSSILRQLEIERYLDENSSIVERLQEPEWPHAGTSFLGFQLLAELGRGSFSRVFLAKQPAVGGRRVVLKVSADLRSEPHVLGRLTHPGIIPIHSTAHDDDTNLSIICMPYLGTATLTDLLDAYKSDHPLGMEHRVIQRVAAGDVLPASDVANCRPMRRLDRSVLELSSRLADAICYAHSRDISHGDLKPSNVLLTFDGRPVVLDFNLAFAQDSEAIHLGGTLPYMAPELLSAIVGRELTRNATSSQAADIFSLGVIYHELFTLSRPVDVRVTGLSTQNAAEQLLSAYHRRSMDSLRGCPPHIAKLIQACLGFEPSSRPTADEIAQQFRRELGLRRTVMQSLRLNRRRFTLAGAALAVLPFAYLPLQRLFADASMRHNYQAGQAAYARDDYHHASLFFTKAMKSAPSFSLECALARAKCALGIGKWNQALTDLEQCQAHAANNGEVCEAMAYCLAQLRRYEEAIPYCALAKQHGRQSAQLLNNLGFCYSARNREGAARVYLFQALERDPSCAQAARNLANLEMRTAMAAHTRPERAIEHAERAMQIAPTASNLLLESATIYAFAAEFEPSHKARALELLTQAARYGADLGNVATHPAFQRAIEPAELQRIAKVAPSQTSSRLESLIRPR